MFDPDNPEDLQKLCLAIESSNTRLQKRREDRVGQLQQYVGSHYGENGPEDDVPVNMIELGVNIFQRGISAHDPQAMVGSDYDDLLPDAACMELALNQQSQRINLKDSFNTCCIEGLFALGLMKVGITSKDTPPDGEGHLHDPGHVFCDPVLFEDAILDMNAKRREQMAYIGDEFTVPLEWAKENKNYDKRAREELTKDEEFNRDTDSNMAVLGLSTKEEIEPSVTLRQVYLARQDKVTMFARYGAKRALQNIDWEGPEGGPYPWLGFGKVPGNIIPHAPVPIWADMHDVVNKMFNKAWRQAARQKTFTAIPPSGAADGNQIVDTKDGEARMFNDPDKIREISTGGANQQTIGMMQLAKDLLVWTGGNWDALGGLAAMSRTVGQDELLTSGASGRIQDMQATFLEFQAEVFRHMAYWMWEDPISEYHLLKQVEGTNYTVATLWKPEDRQGEFFEKNFKISVFPNFNQTPTEKLQGLLRMVQDVLMPAAQMMQPQGMDIDWEYVIKTLSKYMGLPELRRSVKYMNGERIPQKEPQGATRMPAHTTREYNRTNRSAKTRAGQDEAMITELFAGDGTASSSQNAALFSGGAA